LQTWSEVVECSALTGEMDGALRVKVQGMGRRSRLSTDTPLK
jgi:Lrp/AsnC family transcriptional regulator, leucine-responsive regulatory protein